ncbi:hypothetical protein QQS21_001941 [Conoideocrella luteorostrata]|uniref:Xylanolytic transcriptional activator regulatory domain-containing protein n=1 Tax=Conoideocrella luteorostrata TaxID=1105319 RepID=A0AAJ0CVX9_9HYPO|nr:hypothetical protein QQS21_001941 [Conoideocrella luteorostrata]
MKAGSKLSEIQTVASSPQVSSSSSLGLDISDLYVDCILRDGLQSEELIDETGVIKTSGDRVIDPENAKVPSSSLAFFSDPQVEQLTQQIGSDRLKNLIHKIETMIAERLRGRDSSSWTRIHFTKPRQPVTIPKETAHRYINAYFKYIHPIYPFLDRDEFTSRALVYSGSVNTLEDATFSALYHAVLALGSQYIDGGTFQPGQGITWSLYQTALGHVADIIVPKESLENLQALTAMSVFAMNACCLQLEDTLIAEAARMALSLRYHKAANASASQLRTFWVVYFMEKHTCFQNRMTSIISDDDIASPIPPSPDSVFENFNWFLSMIRFARLSSIAYSTLFTVSARRQAQDSYLEAIDRVYQRLENWRLSIPDGFRPGESFHHLSQLTGPVIKRVAVQTHYQYFSMRIVLERLVMSVASQQDVRRENSKHYLMWVARTIIELTRYIDIEPHIPIFIIGVMPMSGLFILFDFVMHNPLHEETRDNIALLDAATGYFSHLEYISKGALPGSIIAEFAHIARDFCYQAERSAKQPSNIGSEPSQNANLDVFSASDGQQDAHFPSETLSMHANGYVQDPTAGAADTALIYPIMDNVHSQGGGQALEYGDMRTFFGALLSDWTTFPD